MFVSECLSDRLFFQRAAHSWTVHPAAMTTAQPLCHTDGVTAEGWGTGGGQNGMNEESRHVNLNLNVWREKVENSVCKI